MCRPNQSSNQPCKNHCLRSCSNNDTIQPTFTDAPTRTMDVAALSSSERSALKTQDPLMFYSIPAARKAMIHGKDASAALTESLAGNTQEMKVERQRRLSTECHPDDALADLFNDPEFMASLEQEMPIKNCDGSDLPDDLFGYFLDSFEMK